MADVDGTAVPAVDYYVDMAVNYVAGQYAGLAASSPPAPVSTMYYHMRAVDSGAGYVFWESVGSSDFAGAGYSGATPTPVGAMVPGSVVLLGTKEVVE